MAIKTLKSEEGVADLIDEIEVMKTMHHPNLVQVNIRTSGYTCY